MSCIFVFLLKSKAINVYSIHVYLYKSKAIYVCSTPYTEAISDKNLSYMYSICIFQSKTILCVKYSCSVLKSKTIIVSV